MILSGVFFRPIPRRSFAQPAPMVRNTGRRIERMGARLMRS
nr:MAG TPA: hypothetical protein [Caudoviricetes sp.]